MSFRYRYISMGPVVFTQEVVDGRTWTPLPGEEAEFDHEISHPFLLLIEPPAKEVEAKEPETAITGDDETEGQ